MERIIKGLQLEEVGTNIGIIEGDFIEKYNMFGNPSARKYTRNVAISSTSKFDPSDDFVYEYIVDDKLVATIYCRRNSFNTVDLYVSEFSDEDEY